MGRRWEEGECLLFDDSFEHEVSTLMVLVMVVVMVVVVAVMVMVVMVVVVTLSLYDRQVRARIPLGVTLGLLIGQSNVKLSDWLRTKYNHLIGYSKI